MRFKAPIIGEQGIVLPTAGNQADVLTRDNTLPGGAGSAKWSTPFRYPAIGTILSGNYTAVGTGAFVAQAVGSTPQWENPAGVTINSFSTFQVPGQWPGIYRFSGWLQFQNAAAGRQARLRAMVNGAVQGASLANGIVSVYNGIAAQYASASGFSHHSLAGGDLVTVQVMHDDTASRAVVWAMAIEWVG
jgi:hypothetical protein